MSTEKSTAPNASLTTAGDDAISDAAVRPRALSMSAMMGQPNASDIRARSAGSCDFATTTAAGFRADSASATTSSADDVVPGALIRTTKSAWVLSAAT